MTHCEVGRVGKQDSPAVIDPLMPVHGALGSLRLKVWDHIAQAKYLQIAEHVRQSITIIESTALIEVLP